jgi:hypothetical protein
MSTTNPMIGAEALSSRDRTISSDSGRSSGRALLDNAGYVLRSLVGSLAVVAVVWAVLMAFRHLGAFAYVLAAVGIAIAVALMARHRNEGL